MPRITPDDLARIREQMAGAMNLREGTAKARVTVHMGTCGIAAGARKIMSLLIELREGAPEQDIILADAACQQGGQREGCHRMNRAGRSCLQQPDKKVKKGFLSYSGHGPFPL